MPVAADSLQVTPGVEEARALASDHNLIPVTHSFIEDCETPVSAFLKLRGDGPAFLLESAEQGQQVGRYSFIGEKVQEEAEEVARAAREESDERVAEEAADVLYHLTVLLHSRGLSLADPERVLDGRRR